MLACLLACLLVCLQSPQGQPEHKVQRWQEQTKNPPPESCSCYQGKCCIIVCVVFLLKKKDFRPAPTTSIGGVNPEGTTEHLHRPLRLTPRARPRQQHTNATPHIPSAFFFHLPPSPFDLISSCLVFLFCRRFHTIHVTGKS